MQKQIKIGDKRIDYKIKLSQKAKRLRLAVYCDGTAVVIQPKNVSLRILEYFVKQKADWLISKLDFFANLKITIPSASQNDYMLNKQKAINLINERTEKFNKIYKFKFNRINIKNQKTRWGSCSKKGNLNFNYRIIYLSDKMIDYIVVHELCHLKEFNHSQKFWNLVAKVIPDYLEIKKELRNKELNHF